MNEKDEGKRSPLLAGRRYVYSTLKDACEEGNEWEGMLVYESVEGRRCRRDREGGDARLHRSSRWGRTVPLGVPARTSARLTARCVIFAFGTA